MSGLLCVAPALVLALALLARRYPGEQRLVVLARSRRRRERSPRRAPGGRVPGGARAAWELFVPRGSALPACALATRPPPCAAPAASC